MGVIEGLFVTERKLLKELGVCALGGSGRVSRALLPDSGLKCQAHCQSQSGREYRSLNYTWIHLEFSS